MLRFRRANYARGADFERHVRDYLYEREEACHVVRSAGSKGAVDLVAFFMGSPGKFTPHGKRTIMPTVWLVQCKADGRFPAEERELLIDLATETGCGPVLAKRGPNGRGIELERLEN